MVNILVLLFLFGYTVLGAEKFNCKRYDTICDNGGTCNTTTGNCDCGTGYHGYKCHIPDGRPCTNTSYCGQNGECYVVNGTNYCGCNLGYFGNSCERNKVEIKCDGSGMEVTFNIPTANFSGTVMAINDTDKKLDSVNCKFEADPTNAGISKMTVKVGQPAVNASNECMTSQFTEAVDAVKGKTTTAQFKILYVSHNDHPVESYLDLLYTIRCDLLKDDLQVYSEVSNVVLDTNSNSSIGINATYSPVTMLVQKEDGTLVGSIVKLGDKLKLLFYLTENTIYKAMTLVSIAANNTLEGEAYREFSFFNNKCCTKMGQKVAGPQMVVTDSKGKPGRSITLAVFKFPATDSVGLVAKVDVCENASDTTCLPPSDSECDAVRKAEGSAGTGGTQTGGGTTNVNGTGGTTNSTGGGTTNTTNTGGGATNATNTSGTNSTSGGTPNTNGGTPNAGGGSANTSGNATTANGGTAGTNAGTAGGGGTSAGGTGGANTGPGTVRKRKRRATTDSEQVVSTVLNIRGPESSTAAAGTGLPPNKVEECFTQKEILAAIIVLGSTVCVLFIACLVLSCILLKRRGSKTSFGSLSTQKLSDRFHIPRPHANEHVNEAYTSL